MKRLICVLSMFCLLFGCGSDNFYRMDDAKSYNADFFQVNELGIFGMIGREGIGYYDYSSSRNILIKQMDDENLSTVQGVCLWNDKIYYFDNSEDAVLMEMDLNGRNLKELYDFSSDDYQYVNTQYKFGYTDGKAVFELNAENLAENGIDTQIYNQIAMVDLETKTFTPITEMQEAEPLRSLHLLSYSPEEILYYEKEYDENMMSMQEYIDQEGSSLNYHLYTEDLIQTTLYSYNLKTKETTILYEDTAVEFETNCDIEDRLVYFRQHDCIFAFDIDTKKREAVYQDDHLYLMNSALGTQLFFMRNDSEKSEYCSYDVKTKETFVFCSVPSDGENQDQYFIPTFETADYYVGLSGEKMRSVISKDEYFKGNYDQVISIGW